MPEEVRGSKRKKKKKEKRKKNCFCNLKKTYFFYCSFLAASLALHFKDYM
jgi:hypothetical protein